MRQRRQGFSLLEVLLALVVVSIITVTFVTAMQTRLRARLLDATAVQMQNWLLAADDYYLQNENYWPTRKQQLIEQEGQDYQSRLPGESLCSGFTGVGLPIVIKDGSNQSRTVCGGKAQYEFICTEAGCEDNAYFGIKLRLLNPNLASQLAERIAIARLSPNDANTVEAYTPVPAITAAVEMQKQQGWIVTGGVREGRSSESTKSYRRVYLPKCPRGFEGHYVTSYLFQATGHRKDGDKNGDMRSVYLNFLEPKSYSNSDKSQSGHVNTDYTLCSATNATTVCKHDENKFKKEARPTDLFYLTFCLPYGKWQPSINVSADYLQKKPRALSAERMEAFSQCFRQTNKNKDWTVYNKNADPFGDFGGLCPPGVQFDD